MAMNVVATSPQTPRARLFIEKVLGELGIEFRYCDSSLLEIDALKAKILITDQCQEWAQTVKKELGIDVILVDAYQCRRPAFNGIPIIGHLEANAAELLLYYVRNGTQHLHIDDIDPSDMEALRPFVKDMTVAARLSTLLQNAQRETERLEAEARRQRRLTTVANLILERFITDEVLIQIETLLGMHPTARDLLYDIPIKELDFSVRTYNLLEKGKKLKIHDLVNTNAREYMEIRNFGRKSLVEVVEKLDHLYNLTIKDWPGSIEEAFKQAYPEN
jgi:hypothetical protein